MEENEDDWEICDLWHDVKHGKGKHEVRMSIHKSSDYRLTYCRICDCSVKFYRKHRPWDLMNLTKSERKGKSLNELQEMRKKKYEKMLNLQGGNSCE